ncbi:MAG: RnfABCDGE type electron transport complex subunit D [Lachnospiraceae bacterium]|nr:RnfABCDGE type electron transport complex subunit D [Lachnospiraceae bacterium]
MNFNLSSSPHVRNAKSTRSIMWDVNLALLPATAFGVYRFGIHALLILLISIATAVLCEFCYQKITHKEVLISDGSAVLTGLLLGLNMPPSVPLWIPVLGSAFAIIFVKQFFGGLGKNFMNPALGGRCFLLISFTSIMSTFTVDGVAGSTPLAKLAAGETTDLLDMFLGYTGGVIGEVSVLAILCGAVYLLVKKIISWYIPVCYLVTFALFMFLFGGFNPQFVLAHLLGGGLMLGAWFMATDYVTSPVSKKGKVIFGILLGILTGVFRLYGATAEGVSYAIIFSNLLVPLIERISMPKAFGLEKVKKEKPVKAAEEVKEEKAEKANDAPKAPVSLKTYHAALNLTVIALVLGGLLGTVYQLTKGPIEYAKQQEELAAYKEVSPDAKTFDEATDLVAAINDEYANGGISAGAFGNVKLDSAYIAKGSSKETIGYVVNVTTSDGFGGDISLSIGVDANGSITGIAFLTINETAGLGMNAKNESFYSQYIGKNVDLFTVTKSGSSSDSEIDALSGATITSKAVTNAVNAALYIADKAE